MKMTIKGVIFSKSQNQYKILLLLFLDGPKIELPKFKSDERDIGDE
jgi:hypothetical protein